MCVIYEPVTIPSLLSSPSLSSPSLSHTSVCHVQYAVESQVRWHGYDPGTAIVFARLREVRESAAGCSIGLTVLVPASWRARESPCGEQRTL